MRQHLKMASSVNKMPDHAEEFHHLLENGIDGEVLSNQSQGEGLKTTEAVVGFTMNTITYHRIYVRNRFNGFWVHAAIG